MRLTKAQEKLLRSLPCYPDQHHTLTIRSMERKGLIRLWLEAWHGWIIETTPAGRAYLAAHPEPAVQEAESHPDAEAGT